MLNSHSPDILFVGLGAPKQEKWMAKYARTLNVPITVGVGAAFDFLSGEKKQAPIWMQKNGLEWLFRLISEPRRLYKRYIFYNLLFIFYLLNYFLKELYVKGKSLKRFNIFYWGQ
jgi:N-acetylglucosaminyldiphosphoundecaprenol N-acetyl-beta-D-mannosaminyltransferase